MSWSSVTSYTCVCICVCTCLHVWYLVDIQQMVAESLLLLTIAIRITERHKIPLNQRVSLWIGSRLSMFDPKGQNLAAGRLKVLSQLTRSRFSTPGQDDKWDCVKVNARLHFAIIMLKKGMCDSGQERYSILKLRNASIFWQSVYTTNLIQDAEPIDQSFSKIPK